MDVDVPDDGVIANGDASAVSISGPVSNGAADGDAACISGAANGAAPSSPVPVASTEDRRLVKAPLPSTSLAGFTVALGRMGREKSERDFQEQICRPVEKLQEFWESHCVRCYLKDATDRDRRTDYGHRTDLCGAGGIAPLRHLNFPKSMICYTCCCPMGTQRSTHPTTVGRGCPRSDVFKRLANAYWVGGFEARLSLIKDGSVSTDAKFAQWLSSVDPSMKDADPHLSVLRIWPFIRDFYLVDALEADVATMQTDLAAVMELMGLELDIAPFFDLFELASAVVREALVHDDALAGEPEILTLLQVAVSVACALHSIYRVLVALYAVPR
ncbi:hypothetical protein NLJ89_g11504 [Agrocybe chaxingu]|uniref:Uncharacterized protein n=1 Tax=Agrocybe chaxingu TaxID=84603 RepID=A0A9W8JPU4_9AGAR|nr:hypothetical protein NLJ89_g11504 [Agrocybe chaxingu]